VEDRIYKSLRTAQEREFQNRPVPVSSEAAAAPSAQPETTPAPVVPLSHRAGVPAEPFALRWFARGSGPDRRRISIVGTLSLSLLICAGVFAAQSIVKHRDKRHADQSIAAASHNTMRVAAHQAADREDDNGGPASVPSRFRHVHPPSAHSNSHSTHAVAVEEQPASEMGAEESSDALKSTPSAKAHRHQSPSHSAQRAADDNEDLQLSELDGPAKPAAAAAQAPNLPANHGISQHNGNEPAIQPIPARGNELGAVAGAPNPAPSNVAIAAGQPAAQGATASNQGADVSAKWPLVPPAAPVAAPSVAVASPMQVSAEASSGSSPTLTIVPGHPDNLSLQGVAPAGRMQPVAMPPAAVQPVAQQMPVDPMPTRSAEASTPYPTQPVSGTIVDRPTFAAPIQPVANPLESVDRTKVMSFQFRNAPWPLVLAKFAGATGLELRMQTMPDGTFNRWDAARYTPSQTLAILNSELARLGCQAKVVGTALYVVPTGDATAPASPPQGVTPAAASSAQLPQFPGVPASATTGAR
jgi:hypothetical protein